MEDNRHIVELLRKYLQETLTEMESRELQQWADRRPEYRRYIDSLTEANRIPEDLRRISTWWPQDAEQWQEGFITKVMVHPDRIRTMPPSSLAENEGSLRSIWRPWKYIAATVAILLVVGTFLFLETRDKKQESRLADTEVLPGGNKATLTLADGRVVELSGAQEGIVIGDGDIAYNDGSLVWSKDGKNKEERQEDISALKTTYYVLNTPKGGTYAITLPDGSKVWLNAASTLKYPERFDGNERIVELEGEAFFEVVRSRKVAKSQSRDGSAATQQLSASAHQPFRVLSKGQTVEVLGTSFNISAYPEESETKTTLVEGKVKIIPSLRGGGTTTRQSSNSDEIASAPASGRAQRTTHRMPRNDGTVLTPGEQSTLSNGAIVKRKVDVDPYVAWREGRFSFKDKSFEQVMAELSRWYDLEVRYTGTIPKIEFYGGAYRNEDIHFILDLLESSEVAYELDGRILTIGSARKEGRGK